MSSRADYRRRERSWEREDRNRDRDRDRDRDKDHSRSARTGGHRDAGRKRDSRSRSPRRDRRDYDRDYKGSRRDDRRDYDRRHDRKEDRKGERKSDRTDERRDRYTPERITHRDRDVHPKEPSRHGDLKRPQDARSNVQFAVRTEPPRQDVPVPTPSKPNLDPDTPVEDGEEMDVITTEDGPMTAMMGLTGFGSTKGKHVDGNQEGAVNIKKMRTWRQYMNRRGGFNRPLDKIK